ncbi:beta strand repeat-containing protein [Humisphaera borealis]|uniref:Autotransporter-associated beta strand repeat-containing protein n=1 Tax=Humisphaera borealis TaxID=2807512 RepID=A0A7M2WSN5_9BACT|nr:autotransporter-associated beta strand repeat-containing protein [Humisphaera borealis]QOV88429.1 autotransporter-associated beta strand repeat-containing protein [Humisphaera borealis]
MQTGPLGTASLTKGNAGTLTLTAANTWTGGTRINNGRLVLAGGDNRLSVAGGLTFGNAANSGIVQLGDAAAASNQTVTNLTISGTGAANAVVGGHTSNSVLTINNSAAITASPIFGGVGTNENNLSLVKTGTGSLTLDKSNSFAGNLDVQSGQVTITNGSALGTGTKTVSLSTAGAAAPSLRLNAAAGFGLDASIALVTSNDDATAPAILNAGGTNIIGGTIGLAGGGFGGGHTRIGIAAGSLAINGNITPTASAGADRVLTLDAAAATSGTINGLVNDNAGFKISVVKEGAGTWTLSGANNYGGSTTVNTGRLNITTAQTGNGAISVATGASLGVSLASAGQTLNAPSLTLAAGASLSLNLGGFGNPSVAAITPTTFSTAAVNQINVAATGLAIGAFDLIDYAGSIGGSGFAGLSLGSLPARVSAELVDAPGVVRLKINSFDLPRWTGAVDAVWDLDPDGTGATGTANWALAGGGATKYLQGTGGTDSVVFDDSATGSTTISLFATTPLTPASIKVDASSKTYTFVGSGRISGSSSLLKTGTSTLILANTGGNDFNGVTSIVGGTLQIGDGSTPLAGQLGTGDVINNAALVFNRPDDLTAANSISGLGSVTKQGAGVLTLSGVNATYTGSITVAAGTLKVGNAAALGTASGNTAVAAGATLDITGFSLSEPIQLNGGTIKSLSGTVTATTGTLTLNGGGTADVTAGTFTISGPVGGTGGFSKSGAGTTVLGGTTSFAGGLTVNAGTLILSTNAGYTGGTTVTGGTLQIGASVSATAGAPGTGDIALNPAAAGIATLNILRGDSLVISNNITSSGAGTNAVTIGAAGSGTITFSGTNTFTGNVTVNAGSLVITNSSALGIGPKSVSLANASLPSLRLDGSAGPITLAAGINFRASSDGSGTNPGAIVNVAGNNIINGDIALVNGGGGQGRVVSLADTLTLNGLIDANTATGARTLLIGGPGNGIVNGAVADWLDTATSANRVVSVTKDGTGTWTLAGTNTFTGAVAIQNGTLRVGSVATNGTAQPLGVASSAITLGAATTSGTFEYTGPTATLDRPITVVANSIGSVVRNSGGGVLTLGGAITKNGTKLTLTGGTFVVNGNITGANANSDLIIDAATVTLAGAASTYNGPTLVYGGATLKNGVLNGIPVGSTLTLGQASSNTAGTFDLGGFDQTLSGIASAGSAVSQVTNSAASGTATLTITGSSSFGGLLKDGPTASLALAKSTGGVLTITGANTYGGPTSVTAGTLLANNSTGSATGSGAVSVSGGGTIGGSGSIAGNLTIAGLGTLSPGNSVGTITTSGGQEWQGGGTYRWEIADPSLAPGTGWDLAELGAGTLKISATPASKFKIDIVQQGSAAPAGAVDPDAWFTIAHAGALTDAAGAPLDLLTVSNLFDLPSNVGEAWEVRVQDVGGGGGYNIQLSAVPEPASLAGIAVAATGLLSRRRRARRLRS